MCVCVCVLCEALLAVAGWSLKYFPSITSIVSVALSSNCVISLVYDFKLLRNLFILTDSWTDSVFLKSEHHS